MNKKLNDKELENVNGGADASGLDIPEKLVYNPGNPFIGNFDGNGKTVNLRIDNNPSCCE